MLVADGVFQQECLSTAAFCLCIDTVIRTFLSRLPPEIRLTVNILAYIDDVVLHMPPEFLGIAWPIWCQCLADVGLRIEQDKCLALVPIATTISPEIDNVVKQSLTGIKLLGSAGEGELEQQLGPFGFHSDPMMKRLQFVELVATHLKRSQSSLLKFLPKVLSGF